MVDFLLAPPYVKQPPPESAYRWAEFHQHNPVKNIRPLPTGRPAHVPKIQHASRWEWPGDRRKRKERQQAVKDCFKHAWQGYKEHAWLQDAVLPKTGGSENQFGGWAATLVDALDTLWIMDLHEEFEEAVQAISQKDFSRSNGENLSVFETTIRYLAGLLAAYDVSGGRYPVLLTKAHEFGDMLYAALDTPTRMPQHPWKWKDAVAGKQMQAGTQTSLASLGSMSLEFTRLSQLTGDPKYYDAIARITDELEKAQKNTKMPGLWPIQVNAAELKFEEASFGAGARADSTYEYLPKEYLLLGDPNAVTQYQRMYEKALDTMKKHLFWRPMTPDNSDLLIASDAKVGKNGEISLGHLFHHLTCFVGGMVEIGAKIFNNPEDMVTGRQLVDACVWNYKRMPTNIMPEMTVLAACPKTGNCTWDEEKWKAETQRKDLPGILGFPSKEYGLRPEAIESVFVHYRITGDRTYQDAAWAMFEGIARLTRTEIANAAIEDVTVAPNLENLAANQKDKMESFWLAETLKYFYLIFSEPSLVSLDDYVFNTEAHPLRRPK
ncbi:MAG: hypothetical protein Q9191_006191 [Dirinaria sp. TL-2023a]